jgi:predicted enzyme related to lactoylglutathione lyase
MKKSIFFALALFTSFSLGYALNSFVGTNSKKQIKMKKVTGIGGVFFKCKDPKKMNEWYKTHLGLNTNPYGASFEWYESPDSSKKAMTQWTPFAETTKYFEPSSKDFMINYRVENLEVLIEQLKSEGVTILDNMETYDYGKFVHILDAEGNKVELWEPIDSPDKK